MNRLSLLLVIFILPVTVLSHVTNEWAFNLGSADSQDFNEDNAVHLVDSLGNIYITTSYPDIVDFDPSVSTFNLVSNGNQQTFVAKYDDAGALLWAKNLPETAGSFINAMATDSDNNLIISGYFNQPTDMDPSAGTSIITPVGTDAQSYLAKYDSDGNLLWVKQHNSKGVVTSRELVIDAANNIYEAGFVGDSIDLDFSASDASFTGWNATFLAKYTEDGDYVWGGIIDSLFSAGLEDFQLLIDGNDLFIKAKAYWDLDVDISPSSVYFSPGTANYDHLVLRYNLDGEIQWAFRVGGPVNDEDGAIAVDDDNIYLVGNFFGTMTNIDPQNGTVLMGSVNGASNLFLASYKRADYSFNWARRIVSSPEDAKSIGMYVAGDRLIIGGTFRGTTDFDPSAVVFNMPANNFQSTFIASYDTSSGDFGWAVSNDDAISVNTFTYNQANKRIVLVGGINATRNVSFEAGNINLVTNGNGDMLLASYTDLYTEVAESEDQINVQVYPNPFADKLTIGIDSNKGVEFLIYDIYGRLVESGTTGNKSEIDLQNLSAGSYYLHLRTDKDVIVKQIIKIK